MYTRINDQCDELAYISLLDSATIIKHIFVPFYAIRYVLYL